MAFLFQGKKPSQTMWVQGPSVDWAQVHNFLAPTPNNQLLTRKTETIWLPAMSSKQQGNNLNCQSLATARPTTDAPPIMDAVEAALKYRGFYMCTIKKRT